MGFQVVAIRNCDNYILYELECNCLIQVQASIRDSNVTEPIQDSDQAVCQTVKCYYIQPDTTIFFLKDYCTKITTARSSTKSFLTSSFSTWCLFSLSLSLSLSRSLSLSLSLYLSISLRLKSCDISNGVRLSWLLFFSIKILIKQTFNAPELLMPLYVSCRL